MELELEGRGVRVAEGTLWSTSHVGTQKLMLGAEGSIEENEVYM